MSKSHLFQLTLTKVGRSKFFWKLRKIFQNKTLLCFGSLELVGYIRVYLFSGQIGMKKFRSRVSSCSFTSTYERNNYGHKLRRDHSRRNTTNLSLCRKDLCNLHTPDCNAALVHSVSQKTLAVSLERIIVC